MEGGALFRVCSEAEARVLVEMAELVLLKNDVGGYAYNDATILITQINRVLERQLFDDSSDGMKGLASDGTNTLNSYKAHQHQRHTRGNYRRIQTQRKSRQQRNGVHPSKSWNVWATTIRPFGQWAVRKTPQQKRIPSEQIGTRFMEPQMASSTVHISSRWFRSKVCGRTTCITSQANIRGELYSNNWMGWTKVHWHHLGLGL